MANLVSPGVSVTITNDSFYIPAAATTVPLFFIATASEKHQSNGNPTAGIPHDPALGTYEYDRVRTVTSRAQAVRLYGVPNFIRDTDGNQHHGDARNEYGLLALQQFLGVGDLAYVVRANVNLNDNRDSILDMWDEKMSQSVLPYGVAYVLESNVTAYLNEYNLNIDPDTGETNQVFPGDPLYKTSVDVDEMKLLVSQSLTEVLGLVPGSGNVQYFEDATFKYTRPDFVNDHTAAPLNVYAGGFDSPATGEFYGLEGVLDQGAALLPPQTWTPVEARNFLIEQADLFENTVEFLNKTTLGANDDIRRQQIVTALKASVASNKEVRSERYEYNLILCPGYWEVTTNLNALVTEIEHEAFVIGDTPMTMDLDELADWSASSDRVISENVGYYYPHGLVTNLDGYEVYGSSSGIALRTITTSDKNSQIWFAPAGTRRGMITGVTAIGYVQGNIGTSDVSFYELHLNRGDMNVLYSFTATGGINPIIFQMGRGLMVWGQRTSTGMTASSLDRVNAVRLLAYIKRALRKGAMPFVFEPNDQLTRDGLAAMASAFLGNILLKRGLYDFAIICDESNNTPDVVERNEMVMDIALKIMKTAEFIYIPIRVVNTAAEI